MDHYQSPEELNCLSMKAKRAEKTQHLCFAKQGNIPPLEAGTLQSPSCLHQEQATPTGHNYTHDQAPAEAHSSPCPQASSVALSHQHSLVAFARTLLEYF
jgi:hypothetical protein